MTSSKPDTRKVFVVHGRNSAARDALFAFLRSLGLQPIEWTEATSMAKGVSPYIGDILEAAFGKAQAIVVLLTGDDEARLRKQLQGPGEPNFEKDLTPQARANVLFEAGIAFGAQNDRTILVELGTLRPFSDISGRYTVRIENSTERRQDLAMRLQKAGCDVNMDGTDWHRAGDFNSAVLETEIQQETHSIPAQVIAEDDGIEALLDAAPQDPRRALIELSNRIEREARQLLATLGLLGNRQKIALKQALQELNAKFGGLLPGFKPAAYRSFTTAQELIANGEASKDEDILMAVESGITILKGIRSLPHETYVVYDPGVVLYKDAMCQDAYTDVKGVILEIVSSGSTVRNRGIYPTTRKHFKKGKKVAWEWNGEQKWGDAWYCDPDTGEAKQAWSMAIEFVGRLLDDV